jgi:hypothetical protein
MKTGNVWYSAVFLRTVKGLQSLISIGFVRFMSEFQKLNEFGFSLKQISRRFGSPASTPALIRLRKIRLNLRFNYEF